MNGLRILTSASEKKSFWRRRCIGASILGQQVNLTMASSNEAQEKGNMPKSHQSSAGLTCRREAAAEAPICQAQAGEARSSGIRMH